MPESSGQICTLTSILMIEAQTVSETLDCDSVLKFIVLVLQRLWVTDCCSLPTDSCCTENVEKYSSPRHRLIGLSDCGLLTNNRKYYEIKKLQRPTILSLIYRENFRNLFTADGSLSEEENRLKQIITTFSTIRNT